MGAPIIDNDGLCDAIELMKQAGTDIADYELKEAKGGFPNSVAESMVAFANTVGGTIILGISEKNFHSVDIDVKKRRLIWLILLAIGSIHLFR